MYLSIWSCQPTCFLYFGCIYWQPEPPNDDLKDTIHSSHFSVKNEGCVIKNSHSFFPQYFRQGRPLNQVILMVILTEKSKIKSIASCVRSNSFYWAFEDVDPRLILILPLVHSIYIKQSIHTKLHRYSADGDTSTTIILCRAHAGASGRYVPGTCGRIGSTGKTIKHLHNAMARHRNRA